MSGKYPKLDLTNDRFNCHLRRNYIIHDSSNHGANYSSLDTRDSAKIPFLAYTERFVEDPPPIPDHNKPYLDSKGNVIELQDRMVNSCGYLKFNEGDLDRFKDQSPKARIDTPMMNKILAPSASEGETIATRLSEGKIPGAKWSTVPRDEEIDITPLGPGYYDILAFERSEKYGVQPKSIVISAIPRFDSEDDELNSISTASRRRRKPKEDESSGEYLRNDEAMYAKISSLSGLGSTKFSDVPRWKSHIYHQEKYAKTNGMKLSHDYDKVFDRRIMFSFDKMASRNFETPPSVSANVDVDPDCGPKMTMETVARTSPMKYANAFRSNAKVGMEIPIPTSGTEIGPGSFPGSEIPAIQIKSPRKLSYFFKRDRDFPVKQAGPEDVIELKSFAETNTKGVKFDEAGASLLGRNAHFLNLSRKKIGKVYPRLEKKLFKNKEPIYC